MVGLQHRGRLALRGAHRHVPEAPPEAVEQVLRAEVLRFEALPAHHPGAHLVIHAARGTARDLRQALASKQ